MPEQAAHTLGLAELQRFLVVSMVELTTSEQTLNSLNVYPVPDGDTGSNLRATWACLFDAPSPQDDDEEAQVRAGVHRLTAGARGNAGVIMSEYVRGCVEQLRFEAGRLGSIDGDRVARMLHGGAAAARHAVAEPVEGTVLSVADAAAAGAVRARSAAVRSGRVAHPAQILDAAVIDATEALRRSPQQLPVLAGAGVVDAGGAGLLFLLEALARVAGGRHGLPRGMDRSWLSVAPRHGFADDRVCQVITGGPAFEFMGVAEGLDDASAQALRRTLSDHGDSVVVAGGRGVHRVHVHTDDILRCASEVRQVARLTVPAVTRFAGPPAALSRVRVDVEDDVLRAYAGAWGCAVDTPAGGPGAPAYVIADATRTSAHGGTRLGHRSTVHAVAVLDACAYAAGVEEEPDFLAAAQEADVLTLLQADTWPAARRLVSERLDGAEHVIAIVDPQADAEHVAAFSAHLDGCGVEVTLLRLVTGVLVQLGVE